MGKFVREKKALTLEEAVYKCTLLPARTIGLDDTGELAVGKNADITIFDFDEITGYEDYQNKTRSPKGIKYVLVNGKLAMENGIVTNGKYGRAL
jgi:N-acyl-D-amino-acid deacylase